MTTNPFGNGTAADPSRNSWCTPRELALLFGAFDLDPCSSPRSHVQARLATCGPEYGQPDGIAVAAEVPPEWRVFIQPPYAQGQVIRWVRAYAHVDFVFLLRWDPSTAWFAALLAVTEWVWFPLGSRTEFEPPPGVKASSNPFPHACFMKSEPSAAMKAAGIWFRVDEAVRALLART